VRTRDLLTLAGLDRYDGQFICGWLIAFGALTRLASIAMIINFIAALAMVHAGLPFASNISPLAMLFCAVFFLFHGPGPFAVETRTRRT
jgi:putative oxidoreductase